MNQIHFLNAHFASKNYKFNRMKAIATIIGVLLIAGGAWLIYDGYQVKQTASARIEKEVTTAIKALTDNSVKTKPEINRKSDIEMFGGAAAAVAGIVLVAAGMRRKRRR